MERLVRDIGIFEGDPWLFAVREDAVRLREALQRQGAERVAHDGSVGELASQRLARMRHDEWPRFDEPNVRLVEAVCAGDVEGAREALRDGASPKVMVPGLDEPLLSLAVRAASRGHGGEAMVDVLIAHGAPVNAVNRFGETPMHEAAAVGSPGLVRRLEAGGANALLRDYAGRTPSELAEGRLLENAHPVLRELERGRERRLGPRMGGERRDGGIGR